MTEDIIYDMYEHIQLLEFERLDEKHIAGREPLFRAVLENMLLRRTFGCSDIEHDTNTSIAAVACELYRINFDPYNFEEYARKYRVVYGKLCGMRAETQSECVLLAHLKKRAYRIVRRLDDVPMQPPSDTDAADTAATPILVQAMNISEMLAAVDVRNVRVALSEFKAAFPDRGMLFVEYINACADLCEYARHDVGRGDVNQGDAGRVETAVANIRDVLQRVCASGNSVWGAQTVHKAWLPELFEAFRIHRQTNADRELLMAAALARPHITCTLRPDCPYYTFAMHHITVLQLMQNVVASPNTESDAHMRAYIVKIIADKKPLTLSDFVMYNIWLTDTNKQMCADLYVAHRTMLMYVLRKPIYSAFEFYVARFVANACRVLYRADDFAYILRIVRHFYDQSKNECNERALQYIEYMQNDLQKTQTSMRENGFLLREDTQDCDACLICHDACTTPSGACTTPNYMTVYCTHCRTCLGHYACVAMWFDTQKMCPHCRYTFL